MSKILHRKFININFICVDISRRHQHYKRRKSSLSEHHHHHRRQNESFSPDGRMSVQPEDTLLKVGHNNTVNKSLFMSIDFYLNLSFP